MGGTTKAEPSAAAYGPALAGTTAEVYSNERPGRAARGLATMGRLVDQAAGL
jgi:hypothetical protein